MTQDRHPHGLSVTEGAVRFDPLLVRPPRGGRRRLRGPRRDGGQTDAPTGTYTAAAAGGWHNCALRTDGTVTCWGDNTHQQTNTPTGTYTAITAGTVHTCALGTDQTGSPHSYW